MTLLAVTAAVSLALVLGALWALYGRLGDRTEGFVLAAGGGALMFSAVLELIVPAQEFISLTAIGLTLMIGAATFAVTDYLIDKRWGDEGGVGLLAAATLDGVPENLALGVALIGAGFWDVAGLAGAIFLSNVPEGASGAKGMRAIGWPRGRILGDLARHGAVPGRGSGGRKPAVSPSAARVSGADARLRRRRHHRSPRHRNLPQSLPPRPPNGRRRDSTGPPRGARVDPHDD